ncbi:2-hydroxy-3-oxopropionate reductase [Candidatus Woesearchaeota archaeon]|nr:2-hydroxy-3-oxopropionate reductase [Candidatus Woesearchaeota archaeon]
MKKIGFIGLGIMGRPMALNLIKAGFSVTVYNRTKSKAEGFDSVANSPKEVAEKCDVIITIVSDSKDVEEVILGKGGIIEGVRSGSIVIDMSSIAPLVTKKIAAELSKKGCEMLDAPVSGGDKGAIAGTLAIMVGGKQEVFDSCKDIFEAMGKNITRVGDVGAGETVKLANQIIVAINIEGMAEALVLGVKAGADPKLLYEAIKTGLAGSNVMDLKFPLVMDRSFKPGFTVKLHHKDLKNVLETASALGLKLPFTEKVQEMFEKLIADGKEELDDCAIVQYIEELNDVQVK